MSISSISSTKNQVYSPLGEDDGIKLLEKQKDQLKTQLQKVNDSKMDAKMKQEKIKEINENIEGIDAQIRQRKLEKIKPTQKEETSASSTQKESASAEKEKTESEKAGGNISSEQMISATVGYSDLKTLKKVRTKLIGELRTEGNSEKAQERSSKLDEIEKDMQKKISKIEKNLKKVAQDGEKVEKNQGKSDNIKETAEEVQGLTKDTGDQAAKEEKIVEEARVKLTKAAGITGAVINVQA